MEPAPSPVSFVRIRELFDQAIEVPPDQHARWLREHVPDIEIRNAVTRLLAADRRQGPLDASLRELFEALANPAGRTIEADDPVRSRD